MYQAVPEAVAAILLAGANLDSLCCSRKHHQQGLHRAVVGMVVVADNYATDLEGIRCRKIGAGCTQSTVGPFGPAVARMAGKWDYYHNYRGSSGCSAVAHKQE